jgi:hypothetical protein
MINNSTPIGDARRFIIKNKSISFPYTSTREGKQREKNHEGLMHTSPNKSPRERPRKLSKKNAKKRLRKSPKKKTGKSLEEPRRIIYT